MAGGMSRAVFIAGAHTDIGKTHVACALLAAARNSSLAVEPLKPVMSGFDPGDWAASDAGRLLTAAGAPLTDATLAAISPWRYAAPLAPPMAARLEGRTLALDDMARFCADRIAASPADLVLVEGVGGLMSPIAEAATGLDLMLALRLPTVLVGGSYLGGLSHTLTALETLRGRALPVSAIVLSQSGDPEAPDLEASARLLAEHAPGVPLIVAPREGPQDRWSQGLFAAVMAAR
jgi:dethiobiotin synthetase